MPNTITEVKEMSCDVRSVAKNYEPRIVTLTWNKCIISSAPNVSQSVRLTG